MIYIRVLQFHFILIVYNSYYHMENYRTNWKYMYGKLSIFYLFSQELKPPSHFLLLTIGVMNTLLIINEILIIISQCMQQEKQLYCQDSLLRTISSLLKDNYSQHLTRIPSLQENKVDKHNQSQIDQQKNHREISQSFYLQQPLPSQLIKTQINKLLQRFQGIHKILLNHSQYQSSLHQAKCGFKTSAIKQTNLIPKYQSKINIINDILQLVSQFQIEKQTKDIQQKLEKKYLQYYMQRHQAGLQLQINKMIQSKLYQQQQYLEESKLYQEEILSLGNQSQIFDKSKAGKQKNEFFLITVQKPHIIEVQIPIIVYKLKEVIRNCEESSVKSQCNNIDSIINKYSKPYEDNYKDNTEQNHHFKQQLIKEYNKYESPLNSQIIGSIMINSNIQSYIPKQTSVQFVYSNGPQQSHFKLPLDSIVQLQSLASNLSGSSTDQHSCSSTESENLIPISEQIILNQKGLNCSFLQKVQKNQRILNQQNIQLKESLTILQQKFEQLQKIKRQLQLQNERYVERLEEQIQKAQYLSNKLNKIHFEALEEKIKNLNNQVVTKEIKIQGLIKSLAQSNKKADVLVRQLQKNQKLLQMNYLQLASKDEQLQILSKQLHQKDQELQQIEICQNTVIEMANSSEERLKRQIQALEAENNKLIEEISEYKNRLKSQGINLQYQQVAQIQNIIQSREQQFDRQLRDINKRYEEVIMGYQQEIRSLNYQLQQIKNLNREKDQLIRGKDENIMLLTRQKEKYEKKIQETIEQSSKKLRNKEQKILSLKEQQFEGQRIYELLAKFENTIDLLENQLKGSLTNIRYQCAQKEQDICSEWQLIEKLTIQLQGKLQQNTQLKQKLRKQQQLLIEQQSLGTSGIKKENDKLRNINKKLKEYTLLLEQQIKSLCKIKPIQTYPSQTNIPAANQQSSRCNHFKVAKA